MITTADRTRTIPPATPRPICWESLDGGAGRPLQPRDPQNRPFRAWLIDNLRARRESPPGMRLQGTLSRVLRSAAKLLLGGLLLGLVTLLGVGFAHADRSSLGMADVTPGPGSMTVYTITNPNDVDIDIQHVITDSSGFRSYFHLGADGD